MKIIFYINKIYELYNHFDNYFPKYRPEPFRQLYYLDIQYLIQYCIMGNIED